MRLALRIYSLFTALLVFVVILYYSAHTQSLVPDVIHDVSTGSYAWKGWPQQQIGYERPSWGALRQVGARERIKENLRVDKKYLISFTVSGWNNQVMDIFNHLDLAVRSDRIPVVAPFFPFYWHYNENNTRDLPVGRVFDLKHLSTVLSDRPIVEAHELKRVLGMADEHSHVVYDGEMSQSSGSWFRKLREGMQIPPEAWGDRDEILGCWSYYGHYGKNGSAPMERFGLDLQYTPLPSTLFPAGNGIDSISIEAAAQLLRQDLTTIPNASLETLDQYPILLRPSVPPDNHLACIDSSYWMQESPGVRNLHGEWHEGGAVWKSVGRHAIFRQELQALADAALVDLFRLDKAVDIPKFIGIHIRRGDFAKVWKDLTPLNYAFTAHGVRQAIWKDLGVDVQRVIVATDETDPDWLQSIRDLGWTLTQDYVAWKVTADNPHDEWLPIVLDSIILSRGVGFVGPSSSTMSILSYLRVKEWGHGVSRFIKPHERVPDGWSWSWDSPDL